MAINMIPSQQQLFNQAMMQNQNMQNVGMGLGGQYATPATATGLLQQQNILNAQTATVNRASQSLIRSGTLDACLAGFLARPDSYLYKDDELAARVVDMAEAIVKEMQKRGY